MACGPSRCWPARPALTLTGFDRYREAQISRAQRAFDHAHDAFWGCGDTLPAIRAEIEQKAHAEGVDPRALLATVFSDEPPLAYAQRITDAIAASPEAQTLERACAMLADTLTNSFVARPARHPQPRATNAP
ncbi:hypothetical protein [Aeromonas veronii]|uniref:hypothetical protein n=1 Tax=Aeromonas veronii TaxID=654 RepID=UPI000EB4EF39|nr:hypothetical protein [Aeromonas veronii]AYK20501.1 hypothetical protein C0073_022590 [Aeromonas veronii]